MQFRAVLAVLAISTGLSQAADKVVGGPYVVNIGPRKATVGWVVESSEVKLGTAPDKLDQSGPVLRSERVTYAGLQPGRTYYYSIPGVEGQGRFKTPPQPGAPFKFVVYGDTRTRHEMHRRVVEGITKFDPDFVIHTGDLVSDGDETKLWPVFFDIERSLLNKTVFLPALGNHEHHSRNYFEFFDVRTPYYSLDWGSAHIVVLDSDFGNAAPSRAAREAYIAAETGWLEADLARAQKADLRIVVLHHPPLTAVKSRQESNRESLALMPVFEKYKVHAVFAGHDHNYQRHLKNGIQYVVTGGGGAPLYPVDAPIPGITQKLESTEHFVTITVEGGKANVQALKLDGTTVIDHFTLP